jgi:ribonucleotide reductase alpha subunit/intein/homing endonuclease
MAIAAQKSEIGITRYFTSEGIHPYDMVEWEIRDSKITNYLDGSVAFEQKGVEVPKDWSLNATNILAQKYFRGTLGTPEREWSLRQVADRIVNTITQWGLSGGYFADQEEANAFSDELKYLIITQRAAFNSPVWFNIGVKGVPQQGSACQPYWALVNTENGLEPIGQLVENQAIGTKVYDSNGMTSIVGVKCNGVKKVLRLTFDAGNYLDVTEDHLVFKCLGDGTEVVQAGELKTGDRLQRIRHYNAGSREFNAEELKKFEALGSKKDAFNVPRELLTAAAPVISAFLRPIFKDSAVFVQPIAKTEELFYLQQLCERLGIFSSIEITDKAEIKISDPYDIERLSIELGIEHLGNGAGNYISWQPVTITDIQNIGETKVYDIQTESGEYLSQGIRIHNCFILSVEDSMASILNWYVEEGFIFKGGSGAGVNLSKIRASNEELKGGGTASGPVSFMRGADSSAGTIKSGGKTRRAAKMVILDIDHPDIEEFIWCKALEERKARVLSENGFDMDIDGKDSHSIQYQNANNSVRVTDEFMQAVIEDKDWELKARVDGRPLKTVKARDLFRQIAQAAWECADPGMQFDTTINKWHTAPNAGRINASNPCSEYMHLDNSSCNLASLNLLKFLDDNGEFDVQAFKAAVTVVFTAQEILVGNADYPTEKITKNTKAYRELGIGYANLGALLMAKGIAYDSDKGRALAAAITSLMTGHAYYVSARTAQRLGPFEGYEKDKEAMNRVLKMHKSAVDEINRDLVPQSILTAAKDAWDSAVELSKKYGVRNSQASVLAPTGCLVGTSLVSTSNGLLRLGTLGDRDKDKWQDVDFKVATDSGPKRATKFFINGLSPTVKLVSALGYEILGTPEHRVKIIGENGAEWRRLSEISGEDKIMLLVGSQFGDSKELDGGEDLAELIAICSTAAEYSGETIKFDSTLDTQDIYLLLKRVLKQEPNQIGPNVFRDPALKSLFDKCGNFEEMIPHLILETNNKSVYSAYLKGLFNHPLSGSKELKVRFKTASLAKEVQVMLLSLGIVSKRSDNILSCSKTALYHALDKGCETSIVVDTIESVESGPEEFTYDLSVPENVTYVANGFVSHNTIGLLMDCDTTGIEPDLSLVKTKKLVGGGTMSIVNQTVPRALKSLGYSKSEIDEIVAYINEHKSIIGAPYLKKEHLSVFACSMGDNTIHYSGHVKMMAAVQPFISGAISKTVNMPEDVSVEDVEQLHIDAWKMGIKAIAIYRDNCKVAQPLSTTKKASNDSKEIEELKKSMDSRTVVVKKPIRERLPRKRRSNTFAFRVADCEGYVTVGEYEDGRPGEVFMKVSKQGSTLAGIMDAFSIAVSLGLQHGVPLSTYVKKYTNMRFEPTGITDDPDIRFASSLVDYIFRRLAIDYLSTDERKELGIMTVGERSQPALPGIEEETIHNVGFIDDLGSQMHESKGVKFGHDAPYCYQCGNVMQRAGSCYVCPTCGTTSGCS